MRKNKGFTLTEILAVIVVISVLALVIAPTIINGIKGSSGDASKAQEQIVFEAANLYMDDDVDQFPSKPGYIYCIPVENLIDKGSLSGTMKDFQNNEDYATKKVKVEIGTEKRRSFALVNDSQCKATSPSDIIITVANNSQWKPSKVATITFPSTILTADKYIYQYKQDNGAWTTALATQNVTFTKSGEVSGTIYARILKKEDTSYPVQEKEKQVLKVDSIAPTCTVALSKTGWTPAPVTVTLASKSDTGGSGLVNYGLTTSTTPTYNGVISVPGATSGTYYGYVIDKAGNTGKCQATAPVQVDTVKPTCSIGISSGSGGWNSWYVSNVGITMTAKGDTGGSGLAAFGMNSNSTAVYNTATSMTHSTDTTSTAYSCFVKDVAGNVGSASTPAFKRDATRPYAPYGRFSFGGDLNVSENCSAKSAYSTSDVYCEIYISTGRYSSWWFDGSYTTYDAGGSGINQLQYYWDHNGDAEKCNWWFTGDCGSWSADDGNGQNVSTFIDYRLRSYDNAGNVSPTTYVRFYISYW